MTQEEKQLLIQDICTRLPYELKIEVCVKDKDIKSVDYVKYDTVGVYIKLVDDENFSIKPYLRSLSLMTNEEKQQFREFISWTYDCNWNSDTIEGIINNNYIEPQCIIKLIDWLNAHQFDYRGLIKKELASSIVEKTHN